MKFCYLLCLFCTILCLFSNAQVDENFADGNFTADPVWAGNATSWTVINGQLRSNSSVASSSFYLSTPSTLAADVQWELFVKLSFNTSGTNYVDIFLISDKEDLKSSNNGYFVRIGGTRDEISLYKRTAGANTLLIDGLDATTNFSASNLKIRVTRTADLNWTLERDLTGAGNSYVTEGTKTDATFTTSAYFGLLVQQSTSGFHNKHFFDDIRITPIDREPPTVKSVQVIDATRIEVVFSEPVTANTARNITNYLADNEAGNPASVSFATTVAGTDATKVILTFAGEFISELPYTLTITNVEDAGKNPMLLQTVPFQYKAPFTPQYRDIVINEIMADPTPAVDLPEAEFIEIYNATSQAINLNGYTLTDGSSTAKLGNVILAPHSYLILCSTTYASLFTPFGSVAGLSSFPSLNNSGETLTLQNAAGKVIDRITYALSWYKDNVKDDGGWTLEQINPGTACNNASNWMASSDVAGGTPGRQNAAYSQETDKNAPSILSVQVISPTQIDVNFSETMDSLLLKNGHYIIDGSLVVSSVQGIAPGYTSVRLNINKALESGIVYTITISGLADCPGNPLPVSKAAFGIGRSPVYHQLLITEIMADESPSVGLLEAEFIELYNPTDQLLSLSGVTFTDDNATVKLGEKLIYPKEYLILCASGAVEKLAAYGKTMSVSGFSLNNSGEQLLLSNNQGQLIFSLKYTPDWYQSKEKSDGGWSLEMIDIHYACVESGNWIASENPSGGTPGKANAVQAGRPDLQAPQLLKVTVENTHSLLLLFDEKLDAANAAIASLYTMAGSQILAAKPISPQFTQVQLTLKQALLPKQIYKIHVQNSKDCSGNISGQLESNGFALPEQADSADVIINEVLFNSRTGGVDFVEIHNRSDKYINLKNWQLANISNDSTANHKLISATDEVMPPHGYKVFTTNSKILKEHYPKAKDENFWFMSSMPSYPDDAGSVVLLNNLQKVSDRFDYSEKMHFTLIDEKSGVSLERISPDVSTGNPGNWHSAASTEGYATPGYKNSQAMEVQQSKQPFSIYPLVFTPDDDGRNDITTFNYLVNKPGNMASIVIYDVEGRQVRMLENNVLLATEGFFSWDGTDDRGEKVRTGRYIIYFTLFDMQGKKQAFKETVIVGTRF